MAFFTAQELAQHTASVVTLPAVYHRVKQVLDDPDGSVIELAKVVAADPGITARILRVVNSVLYGFAGKVETVSRAISLLGMQQIHDIVLATSVSSVFSGMAPERMDVERYWKACALRALVARSAARGCGLLDAERLFVGGLLADIGHMVMYLNVPAQAQAALVDCQASGRPIHEAERALVGCDYAQVGAALLRAWRLPTSFSVAIGAQIDPETGPPHEFEAALLHLARHAVDDNATLHERDTIMARVQPTAWAITQLDSEVFMNATADAESGLAAVIALFFPTLVCA